MAHKKTASGGVRQGVQTKGRRLGVKKFGGERVRTGNIIVRQRGTKYYPGKNTSIGRDHTIFATSNGIVAFRKMTGNKRGKKAIDVVRG